jgi:quercetin dioxygenase-like cupin family protein
MPYKEDGGTHFKSISRQTLFDGDERLPVECRCFEILPGGHSTLERHDHLHVVMVISGLGEVFVRDQVHAIGPQDIVHIPAQTWHQFQATQGEPLSFLCLVNIERDRPHRPTPEEMEVLRQNPVAKRFLKI